MDSAISTLREALEHEQDRRYAQTDYVRKQSKDRETERANDSAINALAQLQVERDVRFLVEELGTARREIFKLRGEVSSLRVQTGRLESERTSQMEVLERGAYLHR